MGIDAVTARDRGEFTAGLTRSADQPFLIDACIDAADYVAIMGLARG